MIRHFVAQIQYEGGEDVVVGACGKVCVAYRSNRPTCRHFAAASPAPDPRKGLTTADMRRYVAVTCATTKKEKLAVTMMED